MEGRVKIVEDEKRSKANRGVYTRGVAITNNTSEANFEVSREMASISFGVYACNFQFHCHGTRVPTHARSSARGWNQRINDHRALTEADKYLIGRAD